MGRVLAGRRRGLLALGVALLVLASGRAVWVDARVGPASSRIAMFDIRFVGVGFEAVAAIGVFAAAVEFLILRARRGVVTCTAAVCACVVAIGVLAIPALMTAFLPTDWLPSTIRRNAGHLRPGVGP